MTISFVSFSAKPESFLDDPSFRYRCDNLAYALNAQGINSKLEHIDSFAVTADLSHVVFHRPRYSSRFRRIVRQLENQGITIIADFDDLVFDPAYLEFSPAVLNNIQPRRNIKRRLLSHFEALQYIRNVTVSTSELGRYVHATFPDAKICALQNYTHHDWPHKAVKPSADKRKVLTYFPGTRSHDRDFWQIEDVVAYFLSKNSGVQLLIIGPLNSRLLGVKSKQVRHLPKLPFTDYIQAASNSWVNLLPLEPTPFNQCKSAIKIIEAGSYNIPTISSPLSDAIRFCDTAASIAIDQQQWLQHLESFLNPKFYLQSSLRIQAEFGHIANSRHMANLFCKSYSVTYPPDLTSY